MHSLFFVFFCQFLFSSMKITLRSTESAVCCSMSLAVCVLSMCSNRFGACHDLVVSRFCCKDYEQFGITGIQIHQVTRVVNRSLRIRFDNALRSYLDDDETYLPSTKSVFFRRYFVHYISFLRWCTAQVQQPTRVCIFQDLGSSCLVLTLEAIQL